MGGPDGNAFQSVVTAVAVAGALVASLMVSTSASADTGRTVPLGSLCEDLISREPTRYERGFWSGDEAVRVSGHYNAGEVISATFTNTDPYIYNLWLQGVAGGAVWSPIAPGQTVTLSSPVSDFTGSSLVRAGFDGYDWENETVQGGTISWSCTPTKDIYTVSPIANLYNGGWGTFNVAKAGSTIPIRFDVTNYWGEKVVGSEISPYSALQRCPNDFVPTEPSATPSAGKSGDYHFPWKTEKWMAGTCWVFTVYTEYTGNRDVYFYFT